MQWESAKDPERDHVRAAYEAGVHAGQAQKDRTMCEQLGCRREHGGDAAGHWWPPLPSPGEPTMDLLESESLASLSYGAANFVVGAVIGLVLGLVLSLLISLAVFA